MILKGQGDVYDVNCVPRVGGGDPALYAFVTGDNQCSPRRRG